ncbi:MAG TPA: adenylate/guanylate cyclase domain-containing protein [Candidatus Limnocylindria bacterium]
MPERSLPVGTVTFLFTDIEGSTRLLSALGDRYPALLATHNRLLRDSIARHGGIELSTEGDAFFAVFGSALEAVTAAAEAQRGLAAIPGSEPARVRVRMGLHTGEGRLGGDDYAGLDVNRAARIAAAGHGGQVLLSDATGALVARDLPEGVALRDLGEHRLKDLPAAERIWQLDIAGLPQEFSALRSIDARPNNLPVSTTQLIGREEELHAIIELLRERRLVTLTGPGGTGKTRLVIALAARLLADFGDGAFFVGLQDARDRAAAAAALASALGIRETLDRDLEQGVKDFLRERELLLVLDNFEQVVSAAPLVAELLAGSPRLRIVVTSRAVLHVSGEQEFGVPPLDLPNRHHLPPLAALSQYEAVALFIERARAVRSDFEVTNENAPAVAEICSRLDGLPLAIELAAARIKVLTPEAILDRLERHLPVLASAGHDVPARQRTLRGAIDWSYELLDEAERRLFTRIAVFVGGWTLEAADEVCNPGDELGIETLDGLASLADKSLIHPVSGGEGESRFAMLQVINEFAKERLDGEPDAGELHRRHTHRFLALAEEAEPELRRSALRRWQHRLRRDEGNLRAALRWAVEGGDVEVGMRTAGALWDYWHYWAELREGRDWLESLLALPAAAQAGPARAKALGGLAALVYWQGDPDRAWGLYEEALAIYRTIGDDAMIAQALFDSAWAAAARRDLASVEARAREAIDVYRRAGDTSSAALVDAWLRIEPLVTGLGGDVNTAAPAVHEAVEMSRRLGRTHDAADWLAAFAFVYRMAGDTERSTVAAQDALRTWYELGNLGRLPVLFKLLAALAGAQGHLERAVRLGAAAERHNEEIGGELSDVFGYLGDPVEEARPLLDPQEHARASDEGRSMVLEELVADALEPMPSAESTPA